MTLTAHRGRCPRCGSDPQGDAAFRAALAAQQPSAPELPRAWGVSRDLASPGQRSVLVSFERALTDDELRALHDLLGGKVVTG